MTDNIAPEADGKPPPTLDIDWKATYDAFSEIHGNNPVLHQGRLLFADGWSHSRTSYKGPEWPPPRDPIECTRLRLVYWQKRRGVVEAQRSALSDMVEGMKAIQASKSGPIRHRVTVRSDDGKVKTTLATLDPALYAGRLNWLSADVLECTRRIQELEADLKSVTPDAPLA